MSRFHWMRAFIIVVLLVSLFSFSGCCSWCCKRCDCDGTGCKPDLVVEEAGYDSSARTVTVKVTNVGNADAGEFMIYIHIFAVDASSSANPKAIYDQYVPSLETNETVSFLNVSLSDFDNRGLNVDSPTPFRLVVRADPKEDVDETDETNNDWEQTY